MLNSITPDDIEHFQNTIIHWGHANYADFPWRATDNRWHSLVAEIMLQRTNAEQVLPAFIDFAAKYSSPREYLVDPDARVFSTLGLIWREKYLRELADRLLDMTIPEDKEQLTKLPGVGNYVASAFRSLHIGIRDILIDSNIVRLYGRYFGFKTDGETRRKKWFIDLAEKLTPADSFRAFNYGLLDFTRAICRPKPQCESCPLSSRCAYFTTQAL